MSNDIMNDFLQSLDRYQKEYIERQHEKLWCEMEDIETLNEEVKEKLELDGDGVPIREEKK